MKRYTHIFRSIVLVLGLLSNISIIAQESAIYAGGAVYRGRDYAIDELRNSGYTTLIIWTIHIENNGDLGFNGEFPLVKNGVYVGNDTYPNFPADIVRLKTAPTSINRVEFGLASAGSGTFNSVRNFYNSEGFGPGTTLYKNFAALKAAVPGIDAFNNDDEVTYHAPSAVAFTKMIASLGFKNAIVPYNNSNFWRTLVSEVNASYPGNVDRNYLQCYAGGSSNNPCSSVWDFGIPVYPGLWGGNGQSSVAAVENRMNSWQNNCGIIGGFMWIYDDFDNTPQVAQYANAINTALGSNNPPGEASNPNPSNNSTNVSTSVTLNWSGGSSAASRQVYFGTDATPDQGELIGTQTTTTYAPQALQPNTTYYWRIDEVNNAGTTTGQVWSFTTEAQTTSNLAVNASISVSSEYVDANWSKEKLTDGITGQNGNGEWASNGEVTPWAQLNWNQNITASRIILYDRPNLFEGINSGTLTFSDGSSVSVGALPNNGTAKEITFAEKNINWVRFTINSGTGPNNGLAEFEIFGIASNMPPGCQDCIDFNSITLGAYSNQDADGSFFVEDNGNSVRLLNNTWKRSNETYNITSNTVISFEFKSSNEGEIHGIGFDENNALSSNRIFKIHGSQNWGIRTYDNYDTPGNYKTYVIPIGNTYTGSAMNLILVNDNDAGTGNTGTFRNIRVYQSGRIHTNVSNSKPIIKDELDDEITQNRDVLDITIYPNPFKEKLQLRIPLNHDFTKAKIFNLSGQLLAEKDLYPDENSIEFNVFNNAAKGIFFLQLENTQKVIIRKLIKH